MSSNIAPCKCANPFLSGIYLPTVPIIAVYSSIYLYKRVLGEHRRLDSLLHPPNKKILGYARGTSVLSFSSPGLPRGREIYVVQGRGPEA